MIEALERHLGPSHFPVSEKMNSLAILSSIATHTRGRYLKEGDSRTKVPCVVLIGWRLFGHNGHRATKCAHRLRRFPWHELRFEGDPEVQAAV